MQKRTSYSIIQSDITKLTNVDVIVNAASETLFNGAGVCGAIHKAAGWKLDEECKKYIKVHGPLPVSGVVTTDSYKLSEKGIKKIIHVVGPMYNKYNPKQSEYELEQAIKNILNEVFGYLKLNSVAIPAISSGIYGFPKELCAQVFKRTIPLDKDIRLCNLDEETCTIFKKVYADPQYKFPAQPCTTPCDSSQQEKIAKLEAEILSLKETIKFQQQQFDGSKSKDIVSIWQENIRQLTNVINQRNCEISKFQEELGKLSTDISLKNNEIAELKNLLENKNKQTIQNSSNQNSNYRRNQQQIEVMPNQEILQNSQNQLDFCKIENNDKITEETIMKLKQELNKQTQFNKEYEKNILDLERKLTDLEKKNLDYLSLLKLHHEQIEKLLEQ